MEIRLIKRIVASALAVLVCIATGWTEVAVTIYNQDLGLVRETREFDFPKGVGELRFIDVAAQIIPTSVHFASATAALLEQNYEYDLISADKLMSKYLDQSVELTTEDKGLFIGTLLSAAGDVVIRERDGSIRSLAHDRIVNVRFPDLPEGLITRPTLVWLVNSSKGGKGEADISYLTHGMSWESEYVAVTNKNDDAISLTGWVNITNNSGATYKDARVKLMAGDVKVIQERRDRGKYQGEFIAAGLASAPQFEEQPFYEYHLYTLQRPSTLDQNQIKQISLFPTADVKKVDKEYRYDGSQGDATKVKVTLIFQNGESNNLGIPLPKGKVRVYKEGPDGGLEFVGEDKIDHTPKDEKVKISTGNAFDVVGELTRTDYKKRGDGNEAAYSIKIRNHKKSAVDVVVAEHLSGDWTMLEATEGWVKKDANTIEWNISVKPDEEKEVTYRVLYSR